MSAKSDAGQNVASLRLPVPFFDLLMVLLVTCLVFVAPIRPDNELQAVNISIAQGKAAKSTDNLLPVMAHRTARGWAFATADGGEVSVDELAQRAQSESRKVVLVVPPATAVQDFVDIQGALAARDIPFALAIRNKETAQ